MRKNDQGRSSRAAHAMPGIARREALMSFLPAFVVYALLDQPAAFAQAPRTSAARWIDRQNEIALALSGGEMTPLAWMGEVERLATEVDLTELMATVSRSRVTSAGEPYHNDPPKRFVRFLDENGEPRRLSYGAALFDFAPHNVITPHGHKHMASAHLVVAGQFRVRNYDRLRDEGEAMVIRPTRDYIASVGQVSTMSSARDNIHWFVPQGGPATTFDVILSGLDPGEENYEIRTIDPLGGRELGDGSILAPIMGFGDSAAKYTADV